MTRPDLICEVLRWDRIAMERDDHEARKSIWRVLDALGGAPVSDRAIAWLCVLDQTPTVCEIREALGIDDSPAWRRRSA
jgi:hypothetical protein